LIESPDEILEPDLYQRRRWIWPWKALPELNRLLRETAEMKHRNERQARRLAELDGLIQRQNAALIEYERAAERPKKKPKKGRRK
jgi:hypothetical protein